MKKSLQFSAEPSEVHSYPSAIRDIQDPEHLFYTPFWLNFVRKNNERDLKAIANGDMTVEQRGLEILFDLDYRKKKELRYKKVKANVLQLQKEGKDVEAMAAANSEYTGVALELAQKRAEGDAEYVEQQRQLSELESESCGPSWLWEACDCFPAPTLNQGASTEPTWALAPSPGLTVH